MRIGEVAIMALTILRTEVSKVQSLQPVLPCHAIIQSCPPVAPGPFHMNRLGSREGLG